MQRRSKKTKKTTGTRGEVGEGEIDRFRYRAATARARVYKSKAEYAAYIAISSPPYLGDGGGKSV